jgi:hypothetical protein
MAAGRASYEIQALHDGHWLTQDIRETENSARSLAAKVLAKHTCQGVRVVKNWQRADGMVTENVIYTEMRSVEAPKVTIVPIDDAPMCQKAHDYYRLESRITINRLFRKYLEKAVLTPTELIHNYRELKRVQDVDTLFPAAVDRVATIQARVAGGEARTRRDGIYHKVAELTQRARTAEEHAGLPTLKGNDFGKVVSKVERIVVPDEVGFYSLVALSRDLVEHRNWLGKLDRLVELTDPGQRDEVIALLDGVIADVLGVPAALQDILGYQRSLAQALCSIADLCEGHFAAETSDARDQIAVLGPLIAKGRLEETRKSLMGRLLQQLSGAQPLNRADPSREREAFGEVARRLFRPEGFLGGPPTAEALTRRYLYLIEEGGKAALRQSVGGVVSLISDAHFGVVYLVDLAASALGEELMPQILGALRQVVRVDHIDDLVAPAWPLRDKLLRVTRLYDYIGGSSSLPQAERAELQDSLDSLLVAFLKRERIVERLDDPAAPLRDRATRLMEFCAAHVLPAASRAQSLTRERVVALIRQPNFEQHYIDGISNPAQAETMLRNLHALMARAGFH